MSSSRVRSFIPALVLLLIVLSAAALAAVSPAPVYAADEQLEAWEKFLALLEKQDSSALNAMVSESASEDFLKGVGEQIKSRDKAGISALKKMKYVKSHRSAEDVVKLGFEVPSKIEGGEYLWVVMKKEKNGFKILNFEPAYSLKFYEMKLKALEPKDADFKDFARKIVNTLKKRLSKNKYTNFNFTIDYESNLITLEISGIDSEQSFRDFITRTGRFALRRLITEKDGAQDIACDELLEYPYFSKKQINKYKVAKEEIVTNEEGQIAATEVTFSGLRVPQVQIDLNAGAKSALEKYTEGFAVKETEEPKLTLACVLDHKVLYTFKSGSKISSGRFWVDDITIVQTANALNAVIAAGPLACPVEITEFKEK